MSQNYIATQKIKGKKINFQNLQTRNDKSQIDFRRINSINNLQTNYNYIKEYLKSRQNKDTKQAKEFSLGTIKIAQNITKGAVNLKKKILTIKTNAEPIEQMKKEAIQKKIEPPNYRPSFTYTFSQTNKPSNDRYKKDSANNTVFHGVIQPPLIFIKRASLFNLNFPHFNNSTTHLKPGFKVILRHKGIR